MSMKTAVLAVLSILLSTPGAAEDSGFESAPVLNASEMLPPELLQGAHHRVQEEVRTDGYLNYYVIDSDFGKFAAEGTPLLRIRVHEIEALAQLEEISETDVFIEAAKGAGIDLGKGLWRGGSDPVNSVKSAPEGANRLFKKLGRGAKLGVKTTTNMTNDVTSDLTSGLFGKGNDGDADEAVDPEEIRKSYYEVSAGQREWAAKLGVNPYSSNQTLRKAIRKMNNFGFAGEITFAVASSLVIPIPGIGTVASTINESADEIWATDPYVLRQVNIERLQNAGVEASLIAAFIDHPWYTPTMQTILLRLLLSMDGVADTMSVLDVAIEAESEAEARYFVNGIMLMVWFHDNEVPIERVLTESHLPQALTTDGRQIAFAPLDYLFWGEYFVGAAQVAVTRPVLGEREIWVLGSVSDRARAEIEALGVSVHDQVGAYVLENAAKPL